MQYIDIYRHEASSYVRTNMFTYDRSSYAALSRGREKEKDKRKDSRVQKREVLKTEEEKTASQEFQS